MGAGGITGGGGVFEQFAIWGVLMQLASAILAPVLIDVQQTVSEGLPNTELSPEMLADLVLKGWVPFPIAALRAKKSGIDVGPFQDLVNDAGEPIALQQLMEAWRRGFIPFDAAAVGDNSVETGILTSRVRNQWTPVLQQLGTIVIPVGDAVSAAIKNQVPYATAQEIAYYSGLSADDFQILYNTGGNPPGPEQLITLARRGFIPFDGTGPTVLTVQQGISEGLTKDKWYPAIKELANYLPPPRTITALERAGAIPTTQAQTLYQQQGLSTQLAAAYSADASAVKLVKTKELAEGQVIDLYKAQIITDAEASSMLGDLGYSAAESTLILEYAALAEELKALNSAVSKVGSLFVARKIGQNSAAEALTVLGLSAVVVTNLMTTWELERGASVKLLSAAEIGDAVKYAIMDQATGQAALESLGYTPYDAWVRLSLSQDGPLPDAPALPALPSGQLP